MVCDLCKDGEAVITLTEIVGSGVRQLHLCEKCAAERGVETMVGATKPQINNFLQTIHEQMPAAKGEPVQCSFCQATLADFRTTGRLGCAHCYEAFESSLRDLLRRVHGNSRHIGRRYVAPLPSISVSWITASPSLHRSQTIYTTTSSTAVRLNRPPSSSSA